MIANQGAKPHPMIPHCNPPTTTGEQEPPSELVAAAYELAAWATKQGWKHWEIGPVADRAALAAEREEYKKALAAACESIEHYKCELTAERHKVSLTKGAIEYATESATTGGPKAVRECFDYLETVLATLK
jgi:hypothetical protein